jgi:hypothetical protein
MAQVVATSGSLQAADASAATLPSWRRGEDLALPPKENSSKSTPRTSPVKYVEQIEEIEKLRTELKDALEPDKKSDQTKLRKLARRCADKTEQLDIVLERLSLSELTELRKGINALADAAGSSKFAELQAKIGEHLPAAKSQEAYLLHRIGVEAERLRRSSESDCHAPTSVQRRKLEEIRLALAAVYKPLINQQKALVRQAIAAVPEPKQQQFKLLLHEKSLEDQRTPVVPGITSPEALYLTAEAIGAVERNTPPLTPEVREELAAKHFAPLLEALGKNHAVVSNAYNAGRDNQLLPLEDACKHLYHLSRLAEARRDDCIRSLGQNDLAKAPGELSSVNIHSPRLADLLLSPQFADEGPFGLPGDELPISKETLQSLSDSLKASGQTQAELKDFAAVLQGKPAAPDRSSVTRQTEAGKVPVDMAGLQAVVLSEKLLNDLTQADYILARYEDALNKAAASGDSAKAEELRSGWIDLSSRLHNQFQESAGVLSREQQTVACRLLEASSPAKRIGAVISARRALGEAKDEIRQYQEKGENGNSPLALYVYSHLRDDRQPIFSGTPEAPALLQKLTDYLRPLKMAEDTARTTTNGLFGINVDLPAAKKVISSARQELERELTSEREKLSVQERSQLAAMLPGLELVQPELATYIRIMRDPKMPDPVFFAGVEPDPGVAIAAYPNPKVPGLVLDLSRSRAAQEIEGIAETLRQPPTFPDVRYQTAQTFAQVQNILKHVKANGRLALLEEDIAAACERIAANPGNKEQVIKVLVRAKEKQEAFTQLERRCLPPDMLSLVEQNQIHKEQERRLIAEAAAKDGRLAEDQDKQSQRQKEAPEIYRAENKREGAVIDSEYARSLTVPPMLALELLALRLGVSDEFTRQAQFCVINQGGEESSADGKKQQQESLSRTLQTVEKIAAEVARSAEAVKANIAERGGEVNAGTARSLAGFASLSNDIAELKKELEKTEDPGKAAEMLTTAAGKVSRQMGLLYENSSAEELAVYKAISSKLAVTHEAKYQSLHSSSLFSQVEPAPVQTFRKYPDYPRDLEPQVSRFRAAKELGRAKLGLEALCTTNDYSLPLACAYAAVLDIVSRLDAVSGGASVELSHDLRALERTIRANPGDRVLAILQLDLAIQKQIFLLAFELRDVPAKERRRLIGEFEPIAAAHSELPELQEFCILYKRIHEGLEKKGGDKLAARSGG